jgi:hypothetical protein
MLGGGPSSGQVNALLVHGRCWRFNQDGHSGRAHAHVRRISCKTFNITCKKYNQVRHYTNICKKPVAKKTRQEVTENSVQVKGSVNINLCQFKVSGNEIEFSKEIRK